MSDAESDESEILSSSESGCSSRSTDSRPSSLDEDELFRLEDLDRTAVALSPKTAPSLNVANFDHGSNVRATTLIKRVNQCTVYEGPSVVHNHFQEASSPLPEPEHRYYDDAKDYLKAKMRYLKPLYVETNGLQESKHILDSGDALFITGNPGTGKTSLAVTMTNYFTENGFKPVLVTSPKDWDKVVQNSANDKILALVDDMFGSIATDEHKVNRWLERNQEITSILLRRKGNIKIICTLRKKIYVETLHRLERFDWYRRFQVVDLSSIHQDMKTDEKRVLMEKYFEHFKIPENKRCFEAVEIDTPHGFPHCVELYCTEHQCRRMGVDFFRAPLKVVEREVQVFQELRSIDFYVLLLVLLSPNQRLNEETLSELSIEESLLKKTRIFSIIPTRDPADIVDAIKKLTGIYFEEYDDGSIGFKHDSLSEIIALVATRFNPIPAVNYLSMLFLAEKTKYLNYTEDDRSEFAILPKKCTKHLVKRITNALFNGEAFSACKHHAWEDPNFLTAWLSFVKETKSQRNVNLTLLEDLISKPIETYTVKQDGKTETVPVCLMFLLYLNKKQDARNVIYNTYANIREENLKLSKFMREQRCSCKPV